MIQVTESLRKLINHPVSQDTARSSVILRRSARTTKGKPQDIFILIILFPILPSDYLH